MKKMLLVALVGIAGLTSCSKDYTCTCVSVLPDGSQTNTETKTISGTKDGAEKKCKAFDNVNGQVTTTCQLD
ncbi:hypothetical protein F0919_16980 [Taibaiella lutea]|uniref:Lipoprotein n=1 Tax=Taibaiella lutea TaxID=2608001 RepID=A0A5M6CBQ6_9BACT|nr:hypothetical protein [Taibaiella lutea]KAA5532481.1 hypothetical protein F0919_16980 [Taibaiella lutea]